VSAGMIVFFFAGWPVPKVAFCRRAAAGHAAREAGENLPRDRWSLLVLFIGPSSWWRGSRRPPCRKPVPRARQFHLERVWVLSAFAALLSNVVSNVPAVLVFKPFMAHLSDPVRSWLTLGCYHAAGNLTILGFGREFDRSPEGAPRSADRFLEYFKVGAPLTVATIAAGVVWLG